jgi:phosphatidylglycerophosphate synthase
MLDAKIRPWIDPPLDAAGRWLAGRSLAADQITVAGFLIGIGGAIVIALGQFALGLLFIAVNRLADGLDGAVARATRPTDRGGFLDIVLDFIFYASIPLAFAIRDPIANALPAAMLIAAFLANGAAFLAFAIVAAKRALATAAQGPKSFFYVAGLAEGLETIAVFCAFCLWPSAFPWLATAFAGLCILSALARLIAGWKAFGA